MGTKLIKEAKSVRRGKNSIVYYTFNPPFTNISALDSCIVSRKEAIQVAVSEDLNCLMGAGDEKVKSIIFKPSLEEIEEALCLSEMNSYILSNV